MRRTLENETRETASCWEATPYRERDPVKDLKTDSKQDMSSSESPPEQ